MRTRLEEGFPRPVAIDVIAHDGIREIWMTTYRNSAKARHLLRDQKAGVAFVREADSASLTGKAEVVTDKDTLRRYWKDFFSHYYPDGPYDENYCLIRFSTQKAKLWIDGKNYGLMASILSSHSESVAFIPSASQWVFRNNSITEYIIWFFAMLKEAVSASEESLKAALSNTAIWDKLRDISVNEREEKMLRLIIDGFSGKLTAEKWAKITKCSHSTALRDITDLLGKGVLLKERGKTKSASYALAPQYTPWKRS